MCFFFNLWLLNVPINLQGRYSTVNRSLPTSAGSIMCITHVAYLDVEPGTLVVELHALLQSHIEYPRIFNNKNIISVVLNNFTGLILNKKLSLFLL